MQKETLEKWSNILKTFFVTNAAKFVYQRIETEQVVVIIGPTGTGKSAIAYHIAFRLKELYEYIIVPARQPSDITQYYISGSKQVFIIDDFIGKYVFDEAELLSWEKESPVLRKVFSNNDNTKVILTCRKNIWHLVNCDRLGVSCFEFDLHTDKFRLTLPEKRKICEKYLKKSDLQVLNDDIIMMYTFLPSLCSFFSSRNVGAVKQFFTLPVQFIEGEMDSYKEKSPKSYMSLSMLAIEHKIGLSNNIEYDKLMKDLLEESGFQIFPSKKLIISQLTSLTCTYIKIENDSFEFIHETMQNIILYCTAKIFINSILKYSKRDVVKHQLRLACIRDEHIVPIIKITSEHEDVYFLRLVTDLRDGLFTDVFENDQSAFETFRQKFIAYLNKNKQEIRLQTNSDGLTVLHVVSSLGYDDFVSLFLKMDNQLIDIGDAKGNTPLHLASMNDHLEIVKLLVKSGRKVHLLNHHKLSPFFYACENNFILVAKYLISFKGDSVKINEKYLSREDKSVLHIASLKGFQSLTKMLLDHYADVDIQDRSGYTPLHLACLTGQYDTASLLINAGANVNALDNLEGTPMYYACTGNYKNIVELLIQNKANVNQSSVNGSTPLHAACEKDSEDIVKVLLANGSTVNFKQKTDETPLHLACKNGHLNIAAILLNNDIEYDTGNVNGWTALFYSCANGYDGVVKLLLRHGAKSNLSDINGLTPLMLACKANHKTVVESLLKSNADLNRLDNSECSSLQYANNAEHIEIVNLLLKHGATFTFSNFKN